MGLFITPSPFRQMLLLVSIVVVVMYIQNNADMSTSHSTSMGSSGAGFELYYPVDEMGHSYQEITNESKHLYPYLAAVISIVCLVGTILGIICLAPE